MAEQAQETMLPAVPFVAVKEAKHRVEELLALTPTGGTAFGITTSYFAYSMISTPEGDGSQEWRIGVSIEVPRFANMVFGKLAQWGLWGSRKTIEFVVKAKANTGHFVKGETRQACHTYTVLNGTYQKRNLSTEMESAKPFRDPKVRMWYGSSFDSSDFEQVLNVIRSELTGQPVAW